MFRRIHGENEDHPDITYILNTLGMAAYMEQDLHDAEYWLRDGVSMKERIKSCETKFSLSVLRNSLRNDLKKMENSMKPIEFGFLNSFTFIVV